MMDADETIRNFDCILEMIDSSEGAHNRKVCTKSTTIPYTKNAPLRENATKSGLRSRNFRTVTKTQIDSTCTETQWIGPSKELTYSEAASNSSRDAPQPLFSQIDQHNSVTYFDQLNKQHYTYPAICLKCQTYSAYHYSKTILSSREKHVSKQAKVPYYDMFSLPYLIP